MAFDGITLNAVVKELQTLKGAKVNSINQPDKNSIVISVYNGNNFAINNTFKKKSIKCIKLLHVLKKTAK